LFEPPFVLPAKRRTFLALWFGACAATPAAAQTFCPAPVAFTPVMLSTGAATLGPAAAAVAPSAADEAGAADDEG
jgi:hypothetical protein